MAIRPPTANRLKNVSAQGFLPGVEGESCSAMDDRITAQNGDIFHSNFALSHINRLAISAPGIGSFPGFPTTQKGNKPADVIAQKGHRFHEYQQGGGLVDDRQRIGERTHEQQIKPGKNG